MKIKKITAIALMAAILSIPYALNCADPDTATTKSYGSVEHYTNVDQTKDGYVLLDFYADWCGPCKRLAPVFKRMAAKYPNIRFLKVNFESYSDITRKYGVRSFPTLILLKDGKVVKRKSGFINDTQFAKWLAPYASA